jgi:hypothetical protein
MMSIRKSAVASVLGLAMLAAAALGYGQSREGRGPDRPIVLSGPDVGFRVEGRKGDSVVGRFVVRIDGHWVDVDHTFGPKPATGER